MALDLSLLLIIEDVVETLDGLFVACICHEGGRLVICGVHETCEYDCCLLGCEQPKVNGHRALTQQDQRTAILTQPQEVKNKTPLPLQTPERTLMNAVGLPGTQGCEGHQASRVPCDDR